MMALYRVSLSRICSTTLRRQQQNSFTRHLLLLPSLSRPPPPAAVRRSSTMSLSASPPPSSQDPSTAPPPPAATPHRWRPMCLYYTQNKCTMMDDHIHSEQFSHDFSKGLTVNSDDLKNVHSQHMDFFLVLDVEGRVEILEFPVLLMNAKTLEVVDFFHRFVRPSEMSEESVNPYIEGKYGKFGVDRVWHDTAIPFNEVIQQFEDWLAQHQLWGKGQDKRLTRAAFVTWCFLRL